MLERDAKMHRDIQQGFRLPMIVIRELPGFKFHRTIQVYKRYFRHILIVTAGTVRLWIWRCGPPKPLARRALANFDIQTLDLLIQRRKRDAQGFGGGRLAPVRGFQLV